MVQQKALLEQKALFACSGRTARPARRPAAAAPAPALGCRPRPRSAHKRRRHCGAFSPWHLATRASDATQNCSDADTVAIATRNSCGPATQVPQANWRRGFIATHLASATQSDARKRRGLPKRRICDARSDAVSQKRRTSSDAWEPGFAQKRRRATRRNSDAEPVAVATQFRSDAWPRTTQCPSDTAP